MPTRPRSAKKQRPRARSTRSGNPSRERDEARRQGAKPPLEPGKSKKPVPRKAPAPSSQVGLRLYTAAAARKYVTVGERDAFLREAERTDRLVRTLCMTLAYGGCRLSEALALTVDRVGKSASKPQRGFPAAAALCGADRAV